MVEDFAPQKSGTGIYYKVGFYILSTGLPRYLSSHSIPQFYSRYFVSQDFFSRCAGRVREFCLLSWGSCDTDRGVSALWLTQLFCLYIGDKIACRPSQRLLEDQNGQ